MLKTVLVSPAPLRKTGPAPVCAAGTFCRGGDAAPAACPEHAHSLPGSSVVEDCACLSPFVMLAGPVSSCVHVTQAEDTFLRWHGALPTVSTYGSKGTLALNVDTLSSVQKQAILDHGDTSCVGILGRVSHCDSEIQGMVMNSSHALVAMQNVLLNPRFVAVLFNVFRDAELDTATYIQRRELWTTALSPQASPNAQAITVFGYVVLQRQSQVDAHYKNVRVMLSSLRAAIYQHVLLSEGAPAVQVLVEPVMVRVSHEWYREDALECIAPAGQRNSVHNPVTSVLSDYNLYDVGQVPCPNAAQLQCLQQVLGASFDSNGTALRCDVGVRILYEGSDDAVLRSKITELVQGVFSVTGVDTSQSPAAVSQFWSLTHSYAAMEAEKTRIQNSVLAAKQDSRDAYESVLFDSGLQSLGYCCVTGRGRARLFAGRVELAAHGGKLLVDLRGLGRRRCRAAAGAVHHRSCDPGPLGAARAHAGIPGHARVRSGGWRHPFDDSEWVPHRHGGHAEYELASLRICRVLYVHGE